MLQAPMDYSLDVIDPFAAGLAGFQMGQQNRMAEQNQQVSLADASQRQAMNAQGMEMNAQTMAQGATTFDQGQQDRATLQAKQQAFAADQSALVGKFQSGAVTAADIAGFSAKYPELGDEMKASFEGLSADRRKNDAFELAKAAAALKAGKPEVAIKMLEDRAVAAENAGLTEEAGMARAMIEQIKLDPAIGLTVAGLALHQLDPEGAKLVFGAGDDAPADVKSLQWRAKQAGLVPGTPEYQAFIAQNGGAGGGDKPASYRALELQAEAAGLTPGTDAYKKFMLTKGAGDVAAARTEGTAVAEAQVSLPDTLAKSQTAIDLIDKIASDPALSSITGNIQGNMAPGIPFITGGQAGTDLNAKIDQLKGKAFLEAFTALKGGGAISEIEGEKATNAIAALNRAQSPEAFKAALDDLKSVIEGAMERAKQKAAGSSSPTAAAPVQGSVEDVDALIREAEGLSP